MIPSPERVLWRIEQLDRSMPPEAADLYAKARALALEVGIARPREAWEQLNSAERAAAALTLPRFERVTAQLMRGGVAGLFTTPSAGDLLDFMVETDDMIVALSGDIVNPARQGAYQSTSFDGAWLNFKLGPQVVYGESGWDVWFDNNNGWIKRTYSTTEIWESCVKYKVRFVWFYDEFVRLGGKPSRTERPKPGPEHEPEQGLGAEDLRSLGRGALWIVGAVAAIYVARLVTRKNA